MYPRSDGCHTISKCTSVSFRVQLGDHFGLGIILGLGSFWGRDHFGAGIILGPGSFRGWDHFGAGIISGLGSFRELLGISCGEHEALEKHYVHGIVVKCIHKF